jgi:hypothetical protein
MVLSSRRDSQEDNKDKVVLSGTRQTHHPLKDSQMTDDRSAVPGGPEELDDSAGTAVDTTVPHSARIWNYWLGGKDNYAVDRVAGDQFSAIFPQIVDIARADRAFLGRVVRFLAGEAGVRQFLDVGTGLPTKDNTHEVAQRAAPESRIVYVDNDPLVLAHARALLTSSQEGTTNYVDADMGDPEKVLQEAAKWLDLTQPVALTLMGVLGHVTDYAEARSIVAALLDGLPAGSYLAINDSINTSEALEDALRQYEASGAVPYRTRSLEQFAGFFDGLELVEPGVVLVADWRPDPAAFPGPEIPQVGAVGRKW